MNTKFRKYYTEFESKDYRGKFTIQIQNDLSQIRFENQDGDCAFDCDKRELKAIRDMIDNLINNEESVEEIEARTERNLELIRKYCEHLKEDFEIEITEDQIISFFEL